MMVDRVILTISVLKKIVHLRYQYYRRDGKFNCFGRKKESIFYVFSFLYNYALKSGCESALSSNFAVDL